MRGRGRNGSNWLAVCLWCGVLGGGVQTGGVDAQQTDPPVVAPAERGTARVVPAPVAGKEQITIAAVGDVMIGSSFPDDSSLPPNDGKDLMTPFTPVLRSADITFGNLEGPLLENGVSTKCPPLRGADGSVQPRANCFAFRVPTRYGQDLKDAGFTVMSVANNHAGDFGEGGRASTREVLEALGVKFAGGDRGRYATTVVEVRGTKVGFAGFAFNEVSPNLNEWREAQFLVKQLKARTDLVVVSFHGGGEGVNYQHVPAAGTTEMFLGEARGDERGFAHLVIDAGADLVLGHGPHVLRGLEVYKDHLIAYSMGNFCTYGMFGLKGETGLTAVFDVTIDSDGNFVRGKMYPGRQNKPGGPVVDPTGEAIQVVRALSRADFGEAAPQIGDDGSFVP